MRIPRAALLLVVCLIGVSSGQKTENDYFPCLEGTVWIYRTTNVTTGEVSQMSRTVQARETSSDNQSVRVVMKSGVVLEYYTILKGSVFVQRLEVPEQKTVVQYSGDGYKELDATPEAGETWVYKDETSDDSATVVGFERVTVPAGVYRAVRVDFRKSFGPFKMLKSLWYAPLEW